MQNNRKNNRQPDKTGRTGKPPRENIDQLEMIEGEVVEVAPRGDASGRSANQNSLENGARPDTSGNLAHGGIDDIETVEAEEVVEEAGPSDETAAPAVPARLPVLRGAVGNLINRLVPSGQENVQLPVWVNWTKDRFFPDDVVAADDERSFMNTSGLVRKGNVILGVFVFGALLWGAVVPLDSAIVAHGEVVVKTHRKTIQHLEGGIVREIRVAEGQNVKAGQILIVLDDTQTQATLSVLRASIDTLTAQEARLTAERDRKDKVEFPPELLARASDPTVAEAIRGEQEAFASRKAALGQQVSVLGQRSGENGRMIAGLRSQQAAVEHQKELLEQEVASVDGLYKQGLSTLPRLLSLQRQVADLTGQAGQLSEKIAQVNLSSGENTIQISRVRQEQLSQIVQDLRDVQTKKYQALDRLHAAEDMLKHSKLMSPVTGTVVSLQAHTVGAVIKPGETVMEIVPKDDRLDVEAQIRPDDADELYPGMDARVNFSAYKQRSLPLITGKVETISADRLIDQRSGQSYFSIIVSVDAGQLKDYPDARLMPGLPVEVEVATGSRTALQYLFSPITRAMRHGMREK